MRPTLPPAGSGHPTLCTPAFKHGGSQLLVSKTLSELSWLPQQEGGSDGGWLWPGPWLLHWQGCTATFCLLPSPAGAEAVAIPPFLHWAGGRQQCCVTCGDAILTNPAIGLWCHSFPWPDRPPAGKPHKGWAEMCVLVHLVGAILSALLNETLWNMPGSPWSC